MRLVQQEFRHVVAALDRVFAVFLAEQSRDVGEDVERARRLVHLEARNGFEAFAHEVATLFETRHHILEVLRIFRVLQHGRHRRFLRDGGSRRRHLPLHFVAGRRDFGGRGDITDTPACHREPLGNAVHDNHAVFEFRELGETLERAVERDEFVNFVRKDIHLRVFFQHIGQRLQFGLGIDHARRVARAVENQKFGFWRNGRFQLSRRNLEVGFDRGAHLYRRTFHKLDHFRIRYPIRRGDDDLVAGIHHGQQHIDERMLAAVGDDNLARFEIHAVVPFEFLTDGLAQVHIARHGRIVRKIVFDGRHTGLLDNVGRIEIGFAHAQVDDIDALSLHLLASLAHGQRGGSRHRQHAVGKYRHIFLIIFS